MTVEAVDLFYLRMPEVRDVGDGSQDALLVRVRAGGYTGWGECEASPLTSMASWIAPMSHSACKPVSASVLGMPIDDLEHVFNIHRKVRENSLDLLQADHTLSGIDMALWDLLGRRLEQPVWRLLGYDRSFPKQPYASVLFGDSPDETREKARRIAADGYRAAKFGWGAFGRGEVAADEAQVAAAREGLGPEPELMVDAGTVWGTDVERAAKVLPALAHHRALWLEEPFPGNEVSAYGELSKRSAVRIAGGEGSHDAGQARTLIEHGGVGFIQIDAGRIGGVTDAHRVARFADAAGVTYVNHTFTSSLALSASLQPYAGLERHVIAEYPTELQPLARELTKTRIERDANGEISAPDAPGLGVEPDLDAMVRYLEEVEIRVGGQVLFRSDEALLRG
jgi:L-alanine-DL-glutamate epimerase-like enolase superfamily enzyme